MKLVPSVLISLVEQIANLFCCASIRRSGPLAFWSTCILFLSLVCEFNPLNDAQGKHKFIVGRTWSYTWTSESWLCGRLTDYTLARQRSLPIAPIGLHLLLEVNRF